MVPQWCLLQFFFFNSYPFSYLSNIYFILRLAGQLAKELSICDMQLKTLLKPYSLYSLSLRLLTLSKDQVNLAQYCVCLCVTHACVRLLEILFVPTYSFLTHSVTLGMGSQRGGNILFLGLSFQGISLVFTSVSFFPNTAGKIIFVNNRCTLLW